MKKINSLEFISHKGGNNRSALYITISKRHIVIPKVVVDKFSLTEGLYEFYVEEDGTLKLKKEDSGFYFASKKSGRLEMRSTKFCKFLFDKYGWDVISKKCPVTIYEDGFLTLITL